MSYLPKLIDLFVIYSCCAMGHMIEFFNGIILMPVFYMFQLFKNCYLYKTSSKSYVYQTRKYKFKGIISLEYMLEARLDQTKS
jgi:hypothetical protein